MMIVSQYGKGAPSGINPSPRPGTPGHVAIRTAIAWTTALLLTGSLSACGSSSGADASSSVSPTSSASSTSSASVSPSPSSTAPSSSTPSASSSSGSATASGVCDTKELTAELTQGAGGGAGSSYPYLVLTNSGSRTCTLRGYPGVSLRHGDTQIGAAAQRDHTVPASTITLKPGESAHSALRIVNAGNFDSADCTPTDADSMLVYPPDQTDAMSIDATGITGCANADTQILYVQVFQQGEQ